MNSINKKPLKIFPKKLGVVLNLVLIFILLVAFFYYSDVTQLLEVLANTQPILFILSVVISLFMTFFVSLRLWVVIKKQGIEIPLMQLVWINMGIRFYSFFSPISSIGSIMRWNRLIPSGKSAEGLAALGMSRVLDIILAISVGIFWGLTAVNNNTLNPMILIVYLIFIIIVLWVSVKASGTVSAWAHKKKSQAPTPTSVWFYSVLEKFASSLSLYGKLSSSEISILLGSFILSDLVGFATYILTALSIKIPISFTDMGWIRALGILVAWTPFTLPGGIGMREVSTIVLMAGLGINTEQAVAFSILLYARSAIVALIGGGVELVLNFISFKK